MKSFHRLCTHRLLCALCAIVLVAATLSACGSTPESVPTQSTNTELSARLDGPASAPDGQRVEILFTVTNNSAGDLYLLTWYTPLEGIFGKIFRVTREGIEIPYEGPLVMRGDPTPEDYVLIESGASVSAEVDLATVYDLAEAGTYTVQFVSPTISDVARTRAEMATTVDELGPVEIPSEPIQIEIGKEGGALATARTGDGTTTTRGTVVDVSPSARIVTLAEVVNGVRVVALTEESELLGADGAEIALREVKPGMIIEATGRRSKAEALLASQVRVVADMYPGWKQYASTDYEFAFRYPPTWVLEEEANLVRLQRGTSLLTVAFRRPDEQVQSASGMPAGEIKGRGTIEFLGHESEKKALVYEGKVKALTYDAHVGNLVLNVRFEDMAAAEYRAIYISEAMQHEVDQIVSSFQLMVKGQ